MRLQKFLATGGLASRRNAEKLILEGRVALNGAIVQKLGTVVAPEKDLVTVDGKSIKFEQKKLYLFNKPKGVCSTLRDPHNKKDLKKYVALTGVRSFPVGRLDRDAFGLMLLTNDGDFADILLHPRHQIVRVYYLLVKGKLSEASIKKAHKGIKLHDGVIKAELKNIAYSKKIQHIFDQPLEGYSIVRASLTEGRKHLVKRLMAVLGTPVKELCRYAHGPFELGNLKPGELLKVKNYLAALSKSV